jgi:hypothetical protein
MLSADLTLSWPALSTAYADCTGMRLKAFLNAIRFAPLADWDYFRNH